MKLLHHFRIFLLSYLSTIPLLNGEKGSKEGKHEERIAGKKGGCNGEDKTWHFSHTYKSISSFSHEEDNLNSAQWNNLDQIKCRWWWWLIIDEPINVFINRQWEKKYYTLPAETKSSLTNKAGNTQCNHHLLRIRH